MEVEGDSLNCALRVFAFEAERCVPLPILELLMKAGLCMWLAFRGRLQLNSPRGRERTVANPPRLRLTDRMCPWRSLWRAATAWFGLNRLKT